MTARLFLGVCVLIPHVLCYPCPQLGAEAHAAHGLGVALAEQALGRGSALLAPPAIAGLHQLLRSAGWRAKLLAAQLYRSQGQGLEAIRCVCAGGWGQGGGRAQVQPLLPACARGSAMPQLEDA